MPRDSAAPARMFVAARPTKGAGVSVTVGVGSSDVFPTSLALQAFPVFRAQTFDGGGSMDSVYADVGRLGYWSTATPSPPAGGQVAQQFMLSSIDSGHSWKAISMPAVQGAVAYFDALNWFAGSTPVRLHAFGGQNVFTPRGGLPERCSDCERDCPYRSAYSETDKLNNVRLTETDRQADTERERPDNCVWLPGSDIVDNAIVGVEYERGVRATLMLSLFGYSTEDSETLEVIGDKGKLIIERHSGAIHLCENYGDKQTVVDARDAEFDTSHFGADWRLIRTLERFADGEPPPVSAADGALASRMSFAAIRSIQQGGAVIDVAGLGAG